MRKWLFIVTIIIFGLACSGGSDSTENVQEQPRQLACIDTLAGVHYPELLDLIPNHIGIGFFHYAFNGDVPALVVSELEKGRAHIRVNILWDDGHEYTEFDYPFIAQAAQVYELICQQFGAKVQLAPVTEHNLDHPEPFLQLIKTHAPSCGKPVNSVLYGAFVRSPEVENEIHGHDVCPTDINCAYSFDGLDAMEQDIPAIRAANSHATRFCVWTSRFNLRYITSDPAPRWQRIREAVDRKPWPALVQHLVNVLEQTK